MANGFGQSLQTGGNTLQEIGASLSGNLPQFQQGQRQQQVLDKEQEDQRQQALFQDAAVIQDHLLNGRTDAALQLATQRKGLLTQLGATDTEGTDTVLQLLQQGNTDAVLKFVTPIVRSGQIRGILDETPSSKFLKISDNGKQAFFQTPKGVVAQDIAGTEGKAPARTSLQKNLIASGLKPGTPEFEAAVREQISKPGQTINIGSDSDLTPDQRIEQAAKEKGAEKLAEIRAKGIGDRESVDIVAGSGSARAVPNLQRSLDLLGEIKTGGIDAVLLKAKQTIGIESANEAELVNALSKNVIAQLKPVFGAQFTKAEGDWLKAIEAGPSKSTAGNIRLIERGIFLAKKRANIGLKAAIAAKDFRSASEIQDFLDTDLTPGAAQAPTETSGASPSGRTDGVVQVDANGNRAMVFPDGTFEEL